jgi:hypothetical protein
MAIDSELKFGACLLSLQNTEHFMTIRRWENAFFIAISGRIAHPFSVGCRALLSAPMR